MNWDGKIERRTNPTDHDTLVRAITILEHHVKNFDTHVGDDKESFKIIRAQIGKHAIFIYIAIGGIGMLEFIMKWIGK